MNYYVIDLDGPNYAFIENLALVASEVLGRPVEDFPHTQDEWSGFINIWGIKEQDFAVLYAIGVRDYGLLWEGEPRPGSEEGWYSIMAEKDSYIHVVTARNPFGAVEHAHEATKFWLAYHGLQYDCLDFTHEKVAAVERNLSELGIQPDRIITVDDRPDHCAEFADAGYESLVYSLAANASFRPELKRVSSMVEVAAHGAENIVGQQAHVYQGS